MIINNNSTNNSNRPNSNNNSNNSNRPNSNNNSNNSNRPSSNNSNKPNSSETLKFTLPSKNVSQNKILSTLPKSATKTIEINRYMIETFAKPIKV